MRMRNPKNMDEILNSCNYFVTEDLFNNDNDLGPIPFTSETKAILPHPFLQHSSILYHIFLF